MKYILLIPILALTLTFPTFVNSQVCSPGTCTTNADCASDEECLGSFGSCGGECYLREENNNISGAPSGIQSQYIESYANDFKNIINKVFVPVLMALAFIVFLWGIFKAYILNPDNETERTKGHQLVLWGVIGFVIVFSLWGIVNLVHATLNLGQAGGNRPDYPAL